MQCRILYVFIISALFIQPSGAQDWDYEFAIGARIGLAYGLNAKYFLRLHPARQPHYALEGMITTRYNGLNGTILCAYHHEIFDTEGFNIYTGGGVHFAVWNSDEVDWETEKYGYNPYTGLDLMIGMEYVIAYVPLAISLDWKPAVNFISDLNLMIDEIGLSLRYLFK
jgi:predicted heme/steroid binding protein